VRHVKLADFLLIANFGHNGSGQVNGYNFLMGQFGLGHFHSGSGWVGSNLDPHPTLLWPCADFTRCVAYIAPT